MAHLIEEEGVHPSSPKCQRTMAIEDQLSPKPGHWPSVLRMLSNNYSDAQAADNLLTAAQYKATEETTSYLN